MFGSIDFQLDLGIHGDQEELLYFRSHLVLVSRLAGIEPPVDGVTTSFDKLELVRADSLRAKRLGFAGKLCIHPRQVPVVNECFEPSAEEVAWAKRIVEGTKRGSGSAISVDGTMVDPPVSRVPKRSLQVYATQRSESDLGSRAIVPGTGAAVFPRTLSDLLQHLPCPRLPPRGFVPAQFLRPA